MKNASLLLLAAVSLLPSGPAQADDFPLRSKPTARNNAVVIAAKSVPANKLVYYISDTPRTGSQIPMVYRRYNGRIDTAANAAVYGSTDLRRVGSPDIGTELGKLDPSITFRRFH